MSVAVDQLHRLRGLGRHDRALTSSLAPPGGSTEATKERLICSPIELATDGAILLRQDGRASWASFHGKSDGRRVFTVEFKRGELERLLGKKQMEIGILQAAQDVVKKSPWLRKGSGR